MAIGKQETNKILIFGAVAGLITPLILKYLVMPVLNVLGGFIPAISLKLAEGGPGTISVAVRDSLTGINGGLSAWLVDALGLTIEVPFMTYVMGAIGGALFFWLGAYVADMAGLLKGNSVSKTRAVIWVGSIVAGFVLGGFAVPQIGLDLVNTLIAFAVNAVILAYVYVALDKKVGLLPF